MITLTHTPYTRTDQALKRAISVIEHYGFSPIEEIMPEYGPKNRSRIPQHTEYVNPFDKELAAVVRSYIEHGHARLKEPTLFYHRGVEQKGSNKVLFGLHVIGLSNSIAEALLIKAALAILDDLNISDHCVYVNSIGDKDSANKFTKELTNYLKKNLADMPSHSRQAFKKDVFYAYEQLLRKQHPLCSEAPCTVEFLSEASRKHFREILEYFEVAEVPYELDPMLIGHRDCYSKTLFEIRIPGEDGSFSVCAHGGRYDELARKAFRQQIPAAGVIFEYEKKGRMPKQIDGRKSYKPRFHFIQVGFEARLRSLVVLEKLRKSRITVHQSLGKEQLTEQLRLTEDLSIPYCIIMGHKEALDGTVIVRNMDTRAQEIIPVERLPEHLRTL